MSPTFVGAERGFGCMPHVSVAAAAAVVDAILVVVVPHGASWLTTSTLLSLPHGSALLRQRFFVALNGAFQSRGSPEPGSPNAYAPSAL